MKMREQVPTEDRWNVEAMYLDFQAWQKDFEAFAQEGKKPRWPEIATFKGKLKSAESLKNFIDQMLKIDRKLSQLYTYAHLRHDEDIAHDIHKQALGKISTVRHDFHEEISWFEPELLSLPQETITSLLKDPLLKEYQFFIEKIVRIKPHVLSQAQEELLALAGKPLQTAHKTFSAINDADFDFGAVLDSTGKQRELSHATYGLYLRDQDRELRKNTFLHMHRTYLKFENTLCELLQGQVQSHYFNAKARKYSSCLSAALFPKNIDPSVYHSLISTVNANLPILHQYVALRKKVLKLDSLHLYDMYVPLTKDLDMLMPYVEAEELVIESVAPLGQEYQDILRKGMKSQRWVDRYENKNKRSGGYSSGCYDSMPYILMNYKNILRDVFTLAHEAGHSMHSYLSHKFQPYHDSDYPIFLAEVASTFNEELLMRLLLKRAKTTEEKIFLLTQKVEDIRATFFRQTMFAEFELFVHEMVEKNIPLTPKILKEKFLNLNKLYFSSLVTIDDEAEIEWARIPHFYYNFYVYQYATGISAAFALAERVLNGGNKERDAYLTFLKSGGSQYPIDILKNAGVDMRTSHPVDATLRKFKGLVEELAALVT